MTYHEVKKYRDQKRHYLIENIRLSKDKWKKITVYLGVGTLSETELKKRIRNKKPILKEKVDNFLRSYDPFFDLLSKDTVEELDQIRNEYTKVLRGMNEITHNSFEEWFITEFTYNTNAIEGSTLSKTDTGSILFDNLMPAGHTLREVNEAKNHLEAYNYMKLYNGALTLRFILELHDFILKNIWDEYAGRIRDIPVYIRNANFTPPRPEKVVKELDELLAWYRKHKKKYHPIVLAAHVHSVFETIHPFVDGNGRVGRLLINFILLENKYPLVNIEVTQRNPYIQALEAARDGNLKPLVELLINGVRNNRLVQDSVMPKIAEKVNR